ncbi:MAG: hypothetical protein AB1478_10595 [Nitrospirota bacterium]
MQVFYNHKALRRKQLIDGIREYGMREGQFKVVEIKPFGIEELPGYFKNYYQKVEGVIDKLRSIRERGINLIQIPMFAELVKIMAMRGRLDPGAIMANNRSWLLGTFVRFIIEEQLKKDSYPDKTIEDKETEYIM